VGLPDPGQGIGAVPTFSPDDVRAYSRNLAEIREWILEGRLRRLPDESGSGMAAPLLRMPAWKEILSPAEVDALVAYIGAVANFPTPEDPRVASGLETAARLGCFTCHGPGGRGATPNPRSLKGYIPPWDGPDFAELAQNELEVREWILDGRPPRLQNNAAARWFLDRQAVRMPGYRGHIDAADLDQILRYVGWLRTAGRDQR
jgi:mono/diheme cytochrome c family protein